MGNEVANTSRFSVSVRSSVVFFVVSAAIAAGAKAGSKTGEYMADRFIDRLKAHKATKR